jgi:hypothetical protein
MKEELLAQIRIQYANSGQDATDLFKLIISIAQVTSLEEALKGLESCVFERRKKWLDNHPDLLEKRDKPVQQGFSLFYEHYLGLSVPEDGQLVENSDRKITVQWNNRCPTLDACVKLGLDTCTVCRLAYERPVQMMLESIDTRLRFVRNYDALRPRKEYCEESIELDS